MILNNSRAEYFRSCLQLAYNTDELKLSAQRTATPLLIGGAFHKALSIINAKTGTLDQAADLAETEYKERAGWDTYLKEEKILGEQDIRLVRSMVKVYGENYQNENYQILAPEVNFCIPLPGTEHHCRYFHNILAKLGEEFGGLSEANQQEIGDGCSDPRCRQPHYLTGTTDAVIQWNRAIWLMEHKTTAYDLHNDSPQSKNWIRNWHLSTQASTYIYGIWKATGIQPHGVLLNVIIKPRKNAANPTFSFYREGFLRTQAQLLRYEKQISFLATEYESRMASGEVWQNPHSCFNYNRQCDFHAECISGEIPKGKFITRPTDYVNAAYYKILGLTPPKIEKEEEHNVL